MKYGSYLPGVAGRPSDGNPNGQLTARPDPGANCRNPRYRGGKVDGVSARMTGLSGDRFVPCLGVGSRTQTRDAARDGPVGVQLAHPSCDSSAGEVSNGRPKLIENAYISIMSPLLVTAISVSRLPFQITTSARDLIVAFGLFADSFSLTHHALPKEGWSCPKRRYSMKYILQRARTPGQGRTAGGHIAPWL